MTAAPGATTARAVLLWCDLYTHGLPAHVAAERRAELESDLHEHRACWSGRHPSALRRDLVVRAALGVPADLTWRTQQRRAVRSPSASEVPMASRPPLDAWTRAAYVVASVVTAWTAVVAVWMLVDARNADAGSYDLTARVGIGILGVIMLGVCVHGLLGLRSHPTRAALELGAAAVAMTAWMMWAGAVLAAGAACLCFFVAFAVRARRQGRISGQTVRSP